MEYNTFKKVNQSIRLAGLSPVQFSLLALSLCLSVITMLVLRQHPVVIVIALMAAMFVLSILFTTLKKEHKKGNPNYLLGKTVKNATPGKIIDRNKIFYFLLKK